MKKYYAFYGLPCDDFSQAELEEYAAGTWLWTPKPRILQGEEVLSPELLAGIGLESGVISYAGLYAGYEITPNTPLTFLMVAVMQCKADIVKLLLEALNCCSSM